MRSSLEKKHQPTDWIAPLEAVRKTFSQKCQHQHWRMTFRNDDSNSRTTELCSLWKSRPTEKSISNLLRNLCISSLYIVFLMLMLTYTDEEENSASKERQKLHEKYFINSSTRSARICKSYWRLKSVFSSSFQWRERKINVINDQAIANNILPLTDACCRAQRNNPGMEPFFSLGVKKGNAIG